MNYISRIFGGIILLLFFLIPFNTAHALTVMPALKKLYVTAGSQWIETITLFNESAAPVTVYPVVENFKAKDMQGTPEFFGDTDPQGAARWIQIPFSHITLKPHEQQNILFKINISQWTTPGGHYAALFWSNVAPDSAQVSAVSRVGSLYLFDVEGAITGTVALDNFYVAKDGAGSIKGFVADITNASNVHVAPRGGIIINKGIYGIKDTLAVNREQKNILAQSKRILFIPWQAQTSFFPLTAHLHIDFDLGFPSVDRTITFYNLPKNAGLDLLGIMAVIVLIVWRWFKKRILKKQHALIGGSSHS